MQAKSTHRLFCLAFGAPRIRAVKKEQKHYHWDWTLAQEPAQRFENLVASHLLKWVHHEQDTRGRNLDLQYFRDTDRREVDFVVVEGRTPCLFVECTWQDVAVDRGLRYLKARFPACDAWQVSSVGTKDYMTPDHIRVAPAMRLLETWCEPSSRRLPGCEWIRASLACIHRGTVCASQLQV